MTEIENTTGNTLVDIMLDHDSLRVTKEYGRFRCLTPEDYHGVAKAIEQYVQKRLTEKYDINDYLQLIEGWVKLKGYVKQEDVIKARIAEHEIDCEHCNIANEMGKPSRCFRLAELKKGLKK